MFPVLETERLILRRPDESDLDAFTELMADPEVTRFLGGPASRTVAWRAIATIAGAWAIQGFGMFSVIDRGSGRWIGRAGPWRPEGWPGSEVGWALTRSAWGQGYATEAARASIEFAFDKLGWDEVIHMIDPLNAPSQAVARRVGSRSLRHGRLPDVDLDLEVWGQTRTDWLARRA
ncbi:MAG TPA: GNAT family N-acetyltransferase [Caulobacteraceae bacterium]|jgi:RimJ/RimL family protein N-acetyltransferase